MGQPEKPKGKPKRKPDDKAQFERFLQSIRKSGVEGEPAPDAASKKPVPGKSPESR